MFLLIKTKTFFFVAIFLFSLLSPSLIPSASASNEETSPLMMFGGDKKFEEKKEKVENNNLSTDEKTAQNRRGTEIEERERDEIKAGDITVGGYCDFLNAVAASDPYHLYNNGLEARGYRLVGQNENRASCLIVRIGEPGHYSYTTAFGENIQSVFLDLLSAMRYCNWLENSTSSSNFNCCEAATEHGVYEIQNDQLISINPDATYFVADEDGPLSLTCCYDKQLCSSLNTFHVVTASVAADLTKKNSGRGKFGSSIQKIEESMIAVALLAGGEERGEALEQARRGATREKTTPSLNTHADGSTPRLMMNPSSIVEGRTEIIERILGIGKTPFTDSLVVRSTVANRTDLAKFTNERPRLLGGGPKPNPTKKLNLTEEKSEQDDLSLSVEEAVAIEKQFKDAIMTYPDAPRLIVKEGEIVPPDPTHASNDRENQEIMRLLKNFITVRYSLDVANGIPELTQLAFISARDLSAAKISEILQRCNIAYCNSMATMSMENGGISTTSDQIPAVSETPFQTKIREAIEGITLQNSSHLSAHYQEADRQWTNLKQAWQEQSSAYHSFKESREKLAISEQKLEQAKKATTSEELQKTRLGKIAKYADIAGNALGKVPEPTTQVASLGISKIAGIADTINSVWAKVNLLLAQRENQQLVTSHQLAQEREGQTRQQVFTLEQHAAQAETFSSEQAEQASKQLAEQLHFKKEWKEREWQAWGNLLFRQGQLSWDEEQIITAIDLARRDFSWIEEVTKKIWQQKIENAKEQLLALKNNSKLLSLERHYQNALEQQKRAQVQEEQQQRFLDEGKQEQEQLKREIEQRVEELESLETRDSIQFEQKKKEFIEKLHQLEKKQLHLQRLQKKWEDSVQQTNKKEQERWISSEDYQKGKEKEERIFARVKKSYQTDKELLQQLWLKSATSNYKEWILPEIFSFQEIQNSEYPSEEKRNNKEIEPPLQRSEEIEARGRNFLLRESIMTSSVAVKTTTPKISSMVRTETQQKNNSLTEGACQKSSMDQVKEWAEKKQATPTSKDQERWEIRKRLDQIQSKIRSKRKEVPKETSSIMGELDDDSDDARSLASNRSKQSTFSQSSSTSSVKKSSIFSFGGRTLFGGSKKSPASALTPISEEGLKFQAPQDTLKQLQEDFFVLKNKYFELLNQAENERLGRFGQAGAIPFEKEEDRNYTWEKADRKSVVILQNKSREQELEKIAEEQEQKWQTNTERWRLRAQADNAFVVLNQAQEYTLKLGEDGRKAKTAEQLSETREKKDEASVKEKRAEQNWLTAEEAWRKSVQKYNDKHSGKIESQDEGKAFERLKERDRAVNTRWKKLLQNYQHPEFERSAVEEEEISEAIMALRGQLEVSYKENFCKYSDQEALANYRSMVFKRALKDACDHPKEMAEAWEEVATAEINIPVAVKEINKQAVLVFKEESRRLEKIETLWQGILESEQQEAAQKRENAAMAYYHQGNRTFWKTLSYQERALYNNEVKAANVEYQEKREENNKFLTFLEERLQKINRDFEEVANKRKRDIRTSSAIRHDQQLLSLGEEKKKLENDHRELQKQIAQQESSLLVAHISSTNYSGEEAFQSAQEKLKEAERLVDQTLAIKREKVTKSYTYGNIDVTSNTTAVESEKLKLFINEVTIRLAAATEQAAAASSETANEKSNSYEPSAWNRVTSKLTEVTEGWQKAKETMLQGSQEIACLWKNAAEQCEASATKWKEVIQSYSSGGDPTGNLEKAAWSINYLSDVAICLAQEMQAEENGNESITDLWHTSKERYKVASKYVQQAAGGIDSENKVELERFYLSGRSSGNSAENLRNAATALWKAMEAEKSGNKNIAVRWRETTRQYKIASEHCLQSARAWAAENEVDAKIFDSTYKLSWKCATYLNKEAMLLLEAMEAEQSENKIIATTIARLFYKSAEQYQLLAEHYRKAIEAYELRNMVKAEYFDSTVMSAAILSSSFLEEATILLKNVIQADKNSSLNLFGETEISMIVALWIESADKYLHASEYMQQAEKSMFSENEVKFEHFYSLGISARDSADKLKDAATVLWDAKNVHHRL